MLDRDSDLILLNMGRITAIDLNKSYEWHFTRYGNSKHFAWWASKLSPFTEDIDLHMAIQTANLERRYRSSISCTNNTNLHLSSPLILVQTNSIYFFAPSSWVSNPARPASLIHIFYIFLTLYFLYLLFLALSFFNAH